MIRFQCTFGLILFSFLGLFSQEYFLNQLQSADPVTDRRAVTTDSMIGIHQDYLARARDLSDTTQMVYGSSFLFRDEMRRGEYSIATEHIMQIKDLATAKNNKAWMGWAEHLEGIVHSRLLRYRESLERYMASAHTCSAAQDSLCMAISYEQVGAMYKKLEILDSSKIYFEKAWPLVDRLAPLRSKGATANNFGNLLTAMDQPRAAIPYYEEVIAVFDSLREPQPLAKAKNNLANAYRLTEQWNKADQLYQELIKSNTSQGLHENLISNYSGLHEMALTRQNYPLAHSYLSTYIEIRDSLTGADVQTQIAELEAKYQSQKKEAELNKKDLQLMAAKHELLTKNALLGLLAVIAMGSIAAFYWRRRMYRAKANAEREKLNLAINLLHKKNEDLLQLNEKLKNQNYSQQANHLYDIKILTDDDWVAFLALYENAYPGYINKIRSSELQLTPAEERLFLLLRLKKSRTEIATILGVSPDTVKKTRSRLRSRIGLSPSDNLEEYILNFGKLAYA